MLLFFKALPLRKALTKQIVTSYNFFLPRACAGQQTIARKVKVLSTDSQDSDKLKILIRFLKILHSLIDVLFIFK